MAKKCPKHPGKRLSPLTGNVHLNRPLFKKGLPLLGYWHFIVRSFWVNDWKCLGSKCCSCVVINFYFKPTASTTHNLSLLWRLNSHEPHNEVYRGQPTRQTIVPWKKTRGQLKILWRGLGDIFILWKIENCTDWSRLLMIIFKRINIDRSKTSHCFKGLEYRRWLVVSNSDQRIPAPLCRPHQSGWVPGQNINGRHWCISSCTFYCFLAVLSKLTLMIVKNLLSPKIPFCSQAWWEVFSPVSHLVGTFC